MKFTIAVGIKPGMSRPEFRTHYEIRHASLADKILGPKGNLLKYIQNFAVGVEADLKLHIPPFGGCTEAWFESVDTFNNSFNDPDYPLLREDEERFSDFNNLVIALAEEHMIFGGSGRPRWKLLRFISCRQGVDRKSFEQFWHSEYSAALAASPEIRSIAPTYVQSRSLVKDDENPFPSAKVVHGIDEFWLRSPSEFQQLVEAERAIMERLDIGRFIDLGQRWEGAFESRVVPGYRDSDTLLAVLE